MQLVLLDRADLCQSFYAPLHRESMPPGVTTSHVKKISLRPGVNLSRSFNLKKKHINPYVNLTNIHFDINRTCG